MGFPKRPYRFGSINKASRLFDKMHDVDTISLLAMVKGYAKKRFFYKRPYILAFFNMLRSILRTFHMNGGIMASPCH